MSGSKLFRLIDLMTMSADDYLSEWFENTHVKAVLAYYSGIGTFAGPRTPGSAYVIMHHVMGEHAGAGGWGFVRGGMGTITQAIAAAGRERGMEIRTEAAVAAIDTAGGRVTGVTLADGSRIMAPIVASNVSAKLTFLQFLPEDALPAAFVRDIKAYRTFSTAFKINIACERLPPIAASMRRNAAFPIRPTPISGPRSNISSGPMTMRNGGIFRASRSSRRWRRVSWMTRWRRRASMWCICSAAMRPTRWRRATGRVGGRNLSRRCCDVMDSHAPGFSDGIIGMQVLMPPDIEAKIGCPHGHIFHGELQMRTSFSFPARRRTGRIIAARLRGCTNAAASAHPGGGVGGVPGHNAAREILRDRRR